MTSSVICVRAGRSAGIGNLLHGRDGVVERAQAAGDAGARGLLRNGEALGDLRVVELVDDAQPNGLSLIGRQLLELGGDHRAELLQAGELLDATPLVLAHHRPVHAEPGERPAPGALAAEVVVELRATDRVEPADRLFARCAAELSAPLEGDREAFA